MTDFIPAELIEMSEAEALLDFEAGAPVPVRRALGLDAVRLGGGVVLSMRNDPSGFWSKALGFGFAEPVTADLVAEICSFYRSSGTPRAVLQLAPSALPEDWADICSMYGLRSSSPWVKVCAIDEVLPESPQARQTSELRIAPVEPVHAAQWGSAMMRTFDMPEEHLGAMAAAVVGREGWHAFAGWSGSDLVATGAMHTHRRAAQFFGGATVPSARRRGAQSALLRASARAAAVSGCRWLVAETGAERNDAHNSSLHNMLRMGFRTVYERENWIWQAERD